MKNVFVHALFFASLWGCSQNSADMKERDKFCRGDDCYLESTKVSNSGKSDSGWVNSTKAMEKNPNSGSDKPLFYFSDTPKDPIEVTTQPGCIEPCSIPEPGEGGIESNPDIQPDRGPPGKGSVLSRMGNDIGKAFSGIAGAFNGSNNKKRTKAKEAQRTLRDATDVIKQATDYGESINAESQSISALGNSVVTSQTGFDNSTSDEAFGGIVDRYDSRTKGILNNTTDIDEKGLTGVKDKGIYHEAAKIEGGRKYVRYAGQRVQTFKDKPDYEARKGLVAMADEAMSASEESYKEGNPQEGNVYYEIGMTLADIALSVTPIIGTGKDFVEAAWGRSILDGHQLTAVERSMAAVGVVTLGLGKLGVFGKIGKLGRILGKAAGGSEEAGKAAKALAEAEKIAASAAKGGIKEKSLIEEAYEAAKTGSPCNFVEVRQQINFFWLLEDTAYAADCLPGGGEEAVRDLLDSAIDAAAKPKLSGSTERLAKFAEPKERKIAEYLENLGRKVEKNELEGVAGAGRQADAVVDGVKTEFKTIEIASPDSKTIKNIVAGGVGQARTILIDARGSALTRSQAADGIFRSLGANGDKLDFVAVIGEGFFVGWGHRIK